VTVGTAIAWAEIELACDDALRDENSARTRIMQLTSQNQRDRGWARLAHAFAVADKDGDALDVARQIDDVAVRVAALLDLRLTLEGLVAMLALEQATAEIDKLTGDARVPLLATLAAAHAAIGRRDRAISIVQQLAEGEERDRALSRVAVALAGQGEYEEGQNLAHELTDDDERDWTLEELTRMLTQAGHWQEAHQLCQHISAEELRARTLVELAIARSRMDDPLAALVTVRGISMPSERTRALMMMVPSLVAQGHTDAALAAACSNGRTPGGASSWEASAEPLLPLVSTSRYLAAITMALAEQGELTQAWKVTQQINRPMDRARAYLAIALAAVKHTPDLARTALGTALHTAILGRAEAFRLLEHAAPVMALLEGTPLLTHIAAEVDIIDTW
jgi:tetratricopeptide (TPR) repeat protein